MGVSPGLYTRFPEWLVPELHQRGRTEAATQTKPNSGFIAPHWAFPIRPGHDQLFFRHRQTSLWPAYAQPRQIYSKDGFQRETAATSKGAGSRQRGWGCEVAHGAAWMCSSACGPRGPQRGEKLGFAYKNKKAVRGQEHMAALAAAAAAAFEMPMAWSHGLRTPERWPFRRNPAIEFPCLHESPVNFSFRPLAGCRQA